MSSAHLTMPVLRDLTAISSRIYTRTRGPSARYYADFRDFKEVGGGQEALIPRGSARATTCLREAESLATARLAELERRKAACPSVTGSERRLGAYAAYHLEQKALNEEADAQWLESAQRHLEHARDFFGDRRDLADIQVRELTEYVRHLSTSSNGRGGTLSSGSINQYLNSFSNLFNRAISEGVLPMGANPVGALLRRPRIKRAETLWLEVHEMAHMLAFAKTYRPARDDLAIPYFHAILAGYALTGCRESELLGLELDDVSLDRQVVRVRPNDWRRLKTDDSSRSIPLCSQLVEIWREYLNGPYRPTGRLMFPALRRDGRPERMITDLRKTLDKMPMPKRFERKRTAEELVRAEAERQRLLARWETGKRGPKPSVMREDLERPVSATVLPPLRTKMLRHTYCAARLQTLDHGRPISIYTVAQEMGHEDITMVKKVYAHLGLVRHRGEEVEYRIPDSTRDGEGTDLTWRDKCRTAA